MNSIAFSILLVLIGIFIGIISVILFNYFRNNNTSKKIENMLEKAKKDADKIKRDYLLEAKDEAHKLKIETDKEIKERKQEVVEAEERLLTRESNMDRRDQTLQNREQMLEEKENNLINKQKDIQSLLMIWSIVSIRHPDWHLHIYGGYGEEKKVLMDMIKEMDGNISVFPPTLDILAKYRESSLLLLTSLFEPFGLVLPEAMSCGLPVVAFDCPYGPREIIRDGVDGFVIENRDIDKFAEKVCLLMTDHNLRVKMGNEGIKSSSRFEGNKIMPLWINLFQSLKS